MTIKEAANELKESAVVLTRNPEGFVEAKEKAIKSLEAWEKVIRELEDCKDFHNTKADEGSEDRFFHYLVSSHCRNTLALINEQMEGVEK